MSRSAAVLLAAFLGSFVPARAADTPAAAGSEYSRASITVAQLFEHNRQSMGPVPTGAYRIVTRTVSTNGDVWIEETLRNGSDYRSMTTQGDFVWSSGSYQGKRWHRDVNGLVLPSSNLFAQLDPFTTALRNAESPTSSVKLLGIASDPMPSFVVDVAPNGWLDERRYYDTQTYLLSRIERTDYDGHRQVWEYRDYRPIFGRMIANDVDYKGDGATVTERSTLSSYERVDSATLDLSIPKSKALFGLEDRESVVIPAEFTTDGIIVRVTIAGRGLDFMLDSGASALVIDPQVAAEFGMRASGVTRLSFGGDFDIANVRSPDFEIGDLRAANVAFSTASVLDEQVPGRRIVGLLGTDFIASGALFVDYQKERLTLLRSLPRDLAAQGWSVLPLRMDYSVPILKAEFSGLPGYFVADLGAYTSVLYPHYFSQFPNKIPRGMRDQGEMMTLGHVPLGYKNLSMRQLVLGDWVFGDVQVVVPSAKYAQDRGYDGLIGRNILMNFNLIFDYSNDQLWFKPITFNK